jgi:hypothetical protein
MVRFEISLFESIVDVTGRLFRITGFLIQSFTLTISPFGTVLHTITITIGGTRSVGLVHGGGAIVSLDTRVFARLIGIKSFNFEIRETHRFIKRSLIDRGIESDGSSRGSVSNNGINSVVHVIIPTNTTDLRTITPSIGSGLDNSSV